MDDASPADPFRFSSLLRRTEAERNYLTELETAFAKSSYSHVEKLMNFALYVPRQTLTKFIAKYEIFRRILNVQGSVVECGVLFGGGLMTFAQLSAILEPVNHQRRIIGFDTFQGFPKVATHDASGEGQDARAGALAVDSYEEIRRCAELFDMNRFVNQLPKVELVRGDAVETIPRYIAENPHLVVSLLYLDFDIYEPTKVALEQFVPRMPKGAVIAFDELNLRTWPGETRAVLDAIGIRSLRIERLPFESVISFAAIE